MEFSKFERTVLKKYIVNQFEGPGSLELIISFIINNNPKQNKEVVLRSPEDYKSIKEFANLQVKGDCEMKDGKFEIKLT